MIKKCTKCRTEKPLSEYFVRDKKTGRLHAQCKACYQAHRQTYYSAHYQKYRDSYLERAQRRREKLRLEFRTKMLKYLSGKSCSVCGESDIRVLELDHIDPSQKRFTISQAVRLGYKWSEVLAEIQKCQILCANCHKKRTAEQYGWYKSQ
jgi:5-methylcytosine-specific restriction endonuclease McrA